MIKLKQLLNEKITLSQLKSVENYVDRLFAGIEIDVTFTKHFKERMNDARNGKDITPDELIQLFSKAYAKHAHKIDKLDPDMERVITDMQSDINVPFVIAFNKRTYEFELVTKTVMRKRGFSSSVPKLRV